MTQFKDRCWLLSSLTPAKGCSTSSIHIDCINNYIGQSRQLQNILYYPHFIKDILESKALYKSVLTQSARQLQCIPVPTLFRVFFFLEETTYVERWRQWLEKKIHSGTRIYEFSFYLGSNTMISCLSAAAQKAYHFQLIRTRLFIYLKGNNENQAEGIIRSQAE